MYVHTQYHLFSSTHTRFTVATPKHTGGDAESLHE